MPDLHIKQEAGTILSSADGVNWTPVGTWPYTITIPNTHVLFDTDITITGVNQYFVCGADDIQFGDTSLRANGSRATFTVSGVLNYPGLIQNGTASSYSTGNPNGFSNISIYNIAVLSNGSTLASEKGWIGQDYFANGAKGNKCVNCFSNGNISESQGGIFGCFLAVLGGTILIVGCSSDGNIGGAGGGIIGSQYDCDNAIITINGCHSSGEIDLYGGGIIGTYSGGYIDGRTDVVNCYSTGSISNYAGGIVGGYSGSNGGNTKSNIKNCYSTGNIHTGSGGIYGFYAAGSFDVEVGATNCYSTGTIDDTCGGIIGTDYFERAFASNCYTAGASGGIGGIYANSNNDGPNNYSESNNAGSGWVNANANNVLNPLTSWVSLAQNQPYELAEMGFTPYSLTNITRDGSLIRSFSQTITKGGTSVASYLTGYKFSIVSGGADSIRINENTGAITANTTGTYTLTIRHARKEYGYSSFILTVVNVAPAPVQWFAPAPSHRFAAAPAPVQWFAPAPSHGFAAAPAPVQWFAPAPSHGFAAAPAPVQWFAPAPSHGFAAAPAPVQLSELAPELIANTDLKTIFSQIQDMKWRMEIDYNSTFNQQKEMLDRLENLERRIISYIRAGIHIPPELRNIMMREIALVSDLITKNTPTFTAPPLLRGPPTQSSRTPTSPTFQYK